MAIELYNFVSGVKELHLEFNAAYSRYECVQDSNQIPNRSEQEQQIRYIYLAANETLVHVSEFILKVPPAFQHFKVQSSLQSAKN